MAAVCLEKASDEGERWRQVVKASGSAIESVQVSWWDQEDSVCVLMTFCFSLEIFGALMGAHVAANVQANSSNELLVSNIVLVSSIVLVSNTVSS